MLEIELPADMSWRSAKIPKKTPGEFRQIRIPNDDLMAAQYAVLDYLYAFSPLRPTKYAHGFVPYRSCMTAVMEHSRRADVILHMDVKDFFDNLPDSVVRLNMKRAGMPEADVDKIIRLCSVDGHFPQGGPCSPWLTNIGMIDVDRIMSAFSKNNGFTYTRYADDIILSKVYDETPCKDRHGLLFVFQFVNMVLEQQLGLQLSWHKNNVMRINDPHKRRCVLGVNIRQDGKGYNAPKFYRRQTRARLHNLSVTVGKQHDSMDKTDLQEWASILGSILYCENVRAYSDVDVCGPDPMFKESEFKYLKEIADGNND